MNASDPCWTCGGTPHPSGLVCICNGTGLHGDEVTGLRDQAAKLNYCVELIADLLPFVRKALPTHMERGGEADRQKLLARMVKVLIEALPDD